MFTFKYIVNGTKFEQECETIEGCLELALHIWEHNSQPLSILDSSGEMIYSSCEIYERLGKYYA
jgi:hypothetical protein